MQRRSPVLDRPRPSAMPEARRRHVHGPIVPMDEPRPLWRRLLGWLA